MLKIKLAFRSIFSQKYYSLINVLGLTIGLSAFLLITLYVSHELSYDRTYEDSDRIYRIVREEYTCSPPAMVPTLKSVVPEIQYASRFIKSTNLLAVVEENYFTEDEYYWTDNEFFNVFSVEFLQGDRKNMLQSPNDIIISEKIARKYFGDKDPMGRIISIADRNEYTVAGVFKDFPGNSHFRFDIVLPIEKYFEITNNDPESWGSNYAYSYVKLHQGTDIASANEKLINLEKELTGWTPESGEDYKQYFSFQPIEEIHLHSHRRQEVQVNGDIKNVYVFSFIGLLILIIAGINYVNLSTAMAENRHKEVGMKKAVGATKNQLIKQFLAESVIVVIISAFIAFILVIDTLPRFGNLMERNLSLNLADILLLVPALLVFSILVGIATGIVPSGSLSRIAVISIIKGNPRERLSGNGLRNALITIQFCVTLILIIMTINVQRQFNYITEKNPGYDKEQIITVRLFDPSIRNNIRTIKDELNFQKNITAVSTSFNLPHKITEFTRPEWFCDDPTECTPISYNPVDYNFVDLFNIEILEGRNFSHDFPSDAKGAFLINEKALLTAGWDSPIGMEIEHYDGQKGKIIGVLKDFNFQSMHSEIAPLYLMLDENVYSYLSIRINGDDITGTLKSIGNIFNNYSPNTPFQYSFFDEEFEKMYVGEKRLRSIFTFFSILAIFLACLGLFGISAFSLSKKTKEMGLRKVFGALNADLLLLLSYNFLIPVITANIIAWPVAYIAFSRWLDSFAYKTNIALWSFLLATIIVLIITILILSLHSKKIAEQNPAISLKYE